MSLLYNQKITGGAAISMVDNSMIDDISVVEDISIRSPYVFKP